MIDIWKLIIIEYWRKNYIFGLIVLFVIVTIATGIVDSISLGQGHTVNLSFQHIAIETISLLFISYFGSNLLHNFNEKKTLQLLRSKKKKPLSFIIQAWGGIYSIYALFVFTTLGGIALFTKSTIPLLYIINLLISGSIALSFIITLSCLTHPYISMIITMIMYIISYSINFILFSTPLHFESNISFKIFSLIQYIFPRFDLLYSTLHEPYTRAIIVLAHIIYSMIILGGMIIIFLRRYTAS